MFKVMASERAILASLKSFLIRAYVDNTSLAELAISYIEMDYLFPLQKELKSGDLSIDEQEDIEEKIHTISKYVYGSKRSLWQKVVGKVVGGLDDSDDAVSEILIKLIESNQLQKYFLKTVDPFDDESGEGIIKKLRVAFGMIVRSRTRNYLKTKSTKKNLDYVKDGEEALMYQQDTTQIDDLSRGSLVGLMKGLLKHIDRKFKDVSLSRGGEKVSLYNDIAEIVVDHVVRGKGKLKQEPHILRPLNERYEEEYGDTLNVENFRYHWKKFKNEAFEYFNSKEVYVPRSVLASEECTKESRMASQMYLAEVQTWLFDFQAGLDIRPPAVKSDLTY